MGQISRVMIGLCGLCVLILSTSKAYGFDAAMKDNSPYCEDLARVTNFCDEIYSFMICPRTCGNNVQRDCGLRKFGSFIPEHEEEGPGIESHVPKRFRRVIGGSEIVQGSWPWLVSLRYKGVLKCEGAVISKDWILTAANCFDKDLTSLDAGDWQVLAGDHSISASEDMEQITGIKKIIIHPRNFKFWKIGYTNIPDDFDVALLKLSRSLQLNSYISPVCLLNPTDHFDGDNQCRVMGWGKSHASHVVHDVPHEASVKLTSRNVCNDVNVYNGSVHHRAICGKFYGKSGALPDACNQDSGGALSCKKNGRWTAVGLISWGYKCGNLPHFGVFTNLHMMRGWIIETLLGYNEQMNSANTIPEVLESLSPDKLPAKDHKLFIPRKRKDNKLY